MTTSISIPKWFLAAVAAGTLLFYGSNAQAEPLRFLSVPQDEGTVKTAEDILPIPAEATEEQKLEFSAAIAQAKIDDVSVTDQAALMYKGLMCLQDEEYEAGVPFLEEALRRDPSLQPAWEGLGWSYIKTDQQKKAKALWLYFRRLMPKESLPYSLLAQMSIIEYDWVSADSYFRKSLEINPDQYDVRYWFGQNLMRIGKNQEAEEIFRKLIEEDPDRLDIQIDLASLLVQRFEYNEAVELYRNVNDTIPDNTKLMLEQALLELRVGELTRADELCQDVLEIDDENLAAMRLRADIAEIAGMHDITPLKDLIDETDDPVIRASLRVRLANRCHLENERKPGQYSTGMILGLLRDAIDEDPANVDYRVLYAERLVQAEHLFDAHMVASEVLEKFNKSNTRAKSVLLEIALREYRYEDARQILSDIYSGFDATNPMHHYYRARIDVMEGLYSNALKELDEMEAAANKGAVFTLLYTDLTESDWTPVTSVRRLHEHIMALQEEGWILIPPTEIDELLRPKPGEIRPDASNAVGVPVTARFFDYLGWCVTGKRKYVNDAKGDSAVEKPKKYFAITFDGDLRSSLLLGNEVAEDFGVPFAIFTPTGPSKEFVPSRAGWEELRMYAETGNWIVGSQLHYAYTKQPVDQDGVDCRSPLPNRIWLESKNRTESMNEWDRRMRTEFRASRNTLKNEMRDGDAIVPMVAYPFSDLGQEGACNLNTLRNPMQTMLAEASRSYKLGFFQSESGYTVFGDNLMLCRRYAPSWTAEGSDIVRHAYENHPTFIARAMRAQIAMLMNRPNLANTMLDVLRRDGYPKELCDKLEVEIHSHFKNKPLRDLKPLVSENDYEDDGTNIVVTSTVNEGSSNNLVELDDPFIGVELDHTKANDQIETTKLGVRAGLNLNKNSTLSAEYFATTMKQTVRPHWNAQVTTNVPYAESIYKFKSEIEDVKVTYTHRFQSGTIMSLAVGQCSKTQESERKDERFYTNLQDHLNEHKFSLHGDDSCTTLTVGFTFNPGDNLKLNFFYDRGFVASAVKNVVYDSASANAEWKPQDTWFLKGHTQYWTYEDDNAMFNATFDSFWEMNPDLGIWCGLQYSVVTTSDPTDFYWSPYWDQRVMGVFRYQQSREGYNLRLDLMAGMQGEKGREDRAFEQPVSEEKEVLVDGVANTVVEQKMEFVISEDKDTGWHRAWGVSCQFEKQLNKYFDVTLEAEVIAMREYIDHFLLLYLRAHF